MFFDDVKYKFESFEDFIKHINKNIDFLSVIEKLNIQPDIKYYKSGTQVMINCPFHYDTDPSLSISLEDNIYHCFSCSASGSLFTFVRKYLNADFIDTISWFMQNYYDNSVVVGNFEYNPIKMLYLINFIENYHIVANNLFLKNKNDAIKKAKEIIIGGLYHNKRFRYVLNNFGIMDKDTFEKMNIFFSFDIFNLLLGFDNKIYEKIGFPENLEFIFDNYLFMPVFYKKFNSKRIISYIFRNINSIDDKKYPKYLSARESLFKFSYVKFGGLDTIKFIKYHRLLQYDEIANRTVFLLEGITDYYAFRLKYNINENIVFIAGTNSIKEEDLELLTNQFGKFVLLFDFDEAGQKLYEEIKKILLAKNKTIIMPNIEKFKYRGIKAIKFADLDFDKDMLIFTSNNINLKK